MRWLLVVWAGGATLALGCRASGPVRSGDGKAMQATSQKSTQTEEGIVFFSGRISQQNATAPRVEAISVQETAGRLKTLPDARPGGPPPFFGFTTVGSAAAIIGYLPHPLHPRMEAQNAHGVLETHISSVPEAEFSLRLPVRPGMDSIRFFEEDSKGRRTPLGAFALISK